MENKIKQWNNQTKFNSAQTRNWKCVDGDGAWVYSIRNVPAPNGEEHGIFNIQYLIFNI